MSSKSAKNSASPGTRSSKPSAADRTVSLFTGRTDQEAAEEAAAIAAAEDIKEDRKDWVREPINPNKEREAWERKAFVDVEGHVEGVRITKSKQRGFYTLEKICKMRGSANPYHYHIMTVPEGLLYLIGQAYEEVCKDRANQVQSDQEPKGGG